MNSKEVMTGERFGQWTVTGCIVQKLTGNRMRPYLPCVCDCGNPGIVRVTELVSGRSRRCKQCHCRAAGWKGNIVQEKTEWLAHQKSQPCMDCGRTFPPYLMQFDHVPERGSKVFQINMHSILRKVTLAELEAERAKCDLVCSLCHDNRTWWRLQGETIQLIPEKCWVR